MSFYNKKEQVLEIKLTQYGKRRLSDGEFRPKYYAFFDDDILYDATFASVESEEQNNIHDRIKDKTPRPEVQYNFAGVETNYKKLVNHIRAGNTEEQFQETPDKVFGFDDSLGIAEPNTQYAPAWSIKFLKSTLSGSTEFVSGSNRILRIPQMSSSIAYNVFLGYTKKKSGTIRKVFDDDTTIRVEEDYILLEVDEKNVVFENENFDIEVFEVEEETDNKVGSGSKREHLIPLSFYKKKKRKIFPILEDESDEEDVIEFDPSYVEYFFDIFTDSEIDKKVLCRAMKENKVKDFFADFSFDCDDLEEDEEIFTMEVVDEEEDIC